MSNLTVVGWLFQSDKAAIDGPNHLSAQDAALPSHAMYGWLVVSVIHAP